MHKTFGLALKEKAIELRLPIDHPSVNYLYKQNPERFPLPFIGCTPDQIEEIKGRQGVTKLPKIYLEFLEHMGVSCGDLFLGYDVTYRYLVGYSFIEIVNRELKKNGHKELDNHFAFWSQQGHTYAFFALNEDDPLLYYYGEVSDEDDDLINGPMLFSDKLSSFLTEFIAERKSKTAQQDFLTEYAK